MDELLDGAFLQGYERLAAWSGLLDDINVFPVADADTGRNLRISLAPLKTAGCQNTAGNLLLSATGNSGNIAGAFFSQFIKMESSEDLLRTATAGKNAAWQALLAPKAGTMLSVFDALVDALVDAPESKITQGTEKIIKNMMAAVSQTSNLLPELRAAGVVDAGALGMFLFSKVFLWAWRRRRAGFATPTASLALKLKYQKITVIKIVMPIVLIQLSFLLRTWSRRPGRSLV